MVTLELTGGPRDGLRIQVDAARLEPAADARQPIGITYGRGYYYSVEPWDGASETVPMFWFYGKVQSEA